MLIVRRQLARILNSFWFLPGLMVAVSVVLGEAAVRLEPGLVDADALYPGGVTGARSVLAIIATGMLAVAGTVFSITIAALSIASSQMGPRLLQNFTRDRSNSFSLGIFVATFAYALVVLRSIGGPDGSATAPRLAVTVAVLLSLIALAVLIYFIHHISNSINVVYVIRLLRHDLHATLATQTYPARPASVPLPQEPDWAEADTVRARHGGYLQTVDLDRMARQAERHGAVVRLLVSPGHYVFQNSPVAQIAPRRFPGFERTYSLGGKRTTEQDLEYAVRQLVEIAARALSPGLNDPYTAIAVIDQLGDALCFMQGRALPSEAHYRGEQLRVLMPSSSFRGLTDTMFNMIRQYGAPHPAVVIRLLEVLTHAAECLVESDRRLVLRHHAQLTYEAGMKHTEAPSDQDDIDERYHRFLRVVRDGAGEARSAPARQGD